MTPSIPNKQPVGESMGMGMTDKFLQSDGALSLNIEFSTKGFTVITGSHENLTHSCIILYPTPKDICQLFAQLPMQFPISVPCFPFFRSQFSPQGPFPVVLLFKLDNFLFIFKKHAKTP